jgi:hypothetical protein
VRRPSGTRALTTFITAVLLVGFIQLVLGHGTSNAAVTTVKSSSAKARMLARIRHNRGTLDITKTPAAKPVTRRLRQHASSWTSLGQNVVGPVSATVRSSGRSIFVRGSNNSIYHRYASGETNWGAWESVGGNITSAVGVDPDFDRENLDIAARGTDGKVWHRAYGFNEPWEQIGDLSIQGTPVVRHYASTDAIIFARGADNAVWMIDQVNFTWQNWVSLGGNITSDLDIAWTGGVAGLFGRGSDNQLMYYPLFASNPSWVALGQTLASAPSVSTPDDTKMDVAVRSSDNTVRYRAFAGGVWKAWASMGGTTNDKPVADYMYVNQPIVDFLAHGTDNHTRERQYHSDTGDSSSWFDLGGTATTFPTPLTFTIDVFGGTAREIYVRGKDGAVWSTWA